mgnify:CR=1 FL=1
MKELLAFVKAENVKTREWINAAPGRAAGLYPEDEAYWVERGISTVAELITFIYDGHKDAYGFRNRGYDFDSMSMAELEAEADRIGDAIEAENKRMDEMYARNTADFEKQVAKYLEMAGSREAAIRWILQAEGLEKEYDAGYICYSLGLPYKMEGEFKQLIAA